MDTKAYQTFGERLKQARKEKKITQSQLAHRIGVSQSVISNLENGVTSETFSLIELAIALNVSPVWLGKGAGTAKIPEENMVIHKINLLLKTQSDEKLKKILDFLEAMCEKPTNEAIRKPKITGLDSTTSSHKKNNT